MTPTLTLTVMAFFTTTVWGWPTSPPIKPLPPPGIKIPPTERAAILQEVNKLGDAIQQLRQELRAKPALLSLLPDVIIYHKAVNDALNYSEIYQLREFVTARELVQRGLTRAVFAWVTAWRLCPPRLRGG